VNYLALLWLDEESEKTGIPNRLTIASKDYALSLLKTMPHTHCWLEERVGETISVTRLRTEEHS